MAKKYPFVKDHLHLPTLKLSRSLSIDRLMIKMCSYRCEIDVRSPFP